MTYPPARPGPAPRRPTARRRPLARAALALAATAALLLSACSGTPTADPDASPATDGSGHDVGVELFQWTWDAIGRECTDDLGPAGYAWVLTSPPQEHILGPAWWTAYQPVSYKIESRLGTRAQFAAMVDACHRAGVEVWTDAILNHMTGQDAPGTGWAGSSYAHYDYPGLYTSADFHHCGLTPDDDIASYLDAQQVQTCELVNLADLDTASPKVRATEVAYLKDLISLGVDGFRIDAAKHMAASDVQAIVAQLPTGTGIVQEVIRGNAEPIQPEDYVGNGKVFEFAWGRDVKGVLAGTPAAALDLGRSGYLPSADALVFVDDHDTERDGSTLSYADGDEYALANVLLLGGAYGQPMVYSGYAFSDRDAGPVQDAQGKVLDARCGTTPGPTAQVADGDWVCQHRWPEVAGMVAWRGVVGDAPVVDRWGQGDAVAFGRGERGFVVVNNGESPLTTTLTTHLPDGRYCDVLTATARTAPTSCGDAAVRVKDGKVDVTVPARTAQAFDVGARAAH